MANITFNIPDNALNDVIHAIKTFNSVPVNSDGQPLFTDNQWAKEAIRRIIVKWVYLMRKSAAEAALNIPVDDSVVS